MSAEPADESEKRPLTENKGDEGSNSPAVGAANNKAGGAVDENKGGGEEEMY